MNKHFKWDSYSDQPYPFKDKVFKKKAQNKFIFDFVIMIATSLFVLPLSFIVMFFLKRKPKKKDFYGMGVNLDKGNEQQKFIEELGIEHILIRLPLSDIKNLWDYFDFAKSFGQKHIVLNILQDRQNIEDLALFRKNLDLIFETFDHLVNEYQIGNAINRFKWGFFSPKEYLDFYQVAYDLKQEKYPHIKLIGSSVIDFEYYHIARTFFNLYPIKYDIASSLLYVDRRGSPKNKQYFFFDAKNKINLLFAMVKLSPKTGKDIYITEANWPLSNTAPYAPTSEKECVSNEEYTLFMEEYHSIAKKSGKIKRVYWHQLIAPGYGLIDNRGKELKKLPQFHAYKKMVQNSKEK